MGRELPILFTGAMVRAILDGRKTVTRRVVTSGTTLMGCGRFADVDLSQAVVDPGRSPFGWDPYIKAPVRDDDEGRWYRAYCRIESGDLLWVRESIRLVDRWHVPSHDGVWGYDAAESVFAADGALTLADSWPWKRTVLPSIHMPKGLARLWLRVTDVRVERLQEIDRHDACAEGVTQHCQEHAPGEQCVSEFRRLWDSLNASRGYGWESNPWVWVVAFEVEDPHGR